MISFNKDSVFNLTPIDNSDVKSALNGLLIEDEYIDSAFRTIRDQLVFTNKRIISIDVQGVTGMRKSFASMPYSRIQYFTVQTKGFLELIPDNELYLVFTDGMTATFEFRGRVNISSIAQNISKYTLG